MKRLAAALAIVLVSCGTACTPASNESHWPETFIPVPQMKAPQPIRDVRPVCPTTTTAPDAYSYDVVCITPR